MKQNMGMLDRTVRIVIAAVIAALYYGHIISGTFGIILLVVAAIFVLTSLVSFCPLYTLFGMSTCTVKKNVNK